MIKEISESLKVEKTQLDRVRKYVAGTKQTIGGYVTLLIKKDMDKVDNKQSKKKA